MIKNNIEASLEADAETHVTETKSEANRRNGKSRKTVQSGAGSFEVETARILLYDTSYYVDLEDMYQRKFERGEDVRKDLNAIKAMANFLTPLTKFVSTEMANKVCYQAIQIHGGCGFMKDFPVERLARDARITNIYEGTTQLQVVAIMSSINSKIFDRVLEEYKILEILNLKDAHAQVLKLMQLCQSSIEKVKALDSKEFLDYVGNYLVEMVSIALSFDVIH